MSPRQRLTRRYKRGRRYWADFRDYRDVGGGQEPLVSEGESFATDDPDEADKLIAARLKELQERRTTRRSTGMKRIAELRDFADQHLKEKAENEDITDAWLEESEARLNAAIEYFGANRVVSTIEAMDIKDWIRWLRKNKKGKRGGQLSDGSIRHYLNALSNMYRTAQENGVVLPGYNPVAAVRKKPKGKTQEAEWFEVHDAALILEAARLHTPKRGDIAHPFTYPLLATLLLTGGRRAEVLGLRVDDISTDRKTVTFRTNEYRRLKTSKSERVIPLWPQLAQILDDYAATCPLGDLLFPARVGSTEQIVWNYEKQFDAIAATLNWPNAMIRAQKLRNTYCAARLQTLDRGAPVSVYSVSREMGHGSTAMVQRVYGHLGEVRHRSEVVEYRVEQHMKKLAERLTVLRAAHEDKA